MHATDECGTCEYVIVSCERSKLAHSGLCTGTGIVEAGHREQAFIAKLINCWSFLLAYLARLVLD